MNTLFFLVLSFYLSLAGMRSTLLADEGDIGGAFEEASVLLSGIDGLEFQELEAGQLRLKGEIQRVGDLKKVKQLLSRHPEIDNKTHLSRDAILFAEKELRSRIKRVSPNSELKMSGSKFILIGAVSPSFLHELQNYYPDIILEEPEHHSRKIEPTILLEMALVEVKKSALQKLGTHLNGNISAGSNFDFKFLPKERGDWNIQSMDPIRAFLDLALQHGEAKIHAKQSIVTQNGKEGEFQAGGEFPIKIVSAHSSRVEYKQFGLFLKFTPFLESPPTIHLIVHSEVSDIDLGSQVDGLPMIVKKELKTQVFARLNEMMALGGVIRASQSKFSDEIPGLSSIPVLGRLFRSEDFKSQKSEAYLFITAKKMEGAWLPSPDL
ncbi:MAG: pilQ 2 [Bacteriovoracaceae bacterium]|nr:pilQ 2 [Bacteriovoracaceae bacterium]